MCGVRGFKTMEKAILLISGVLQNYRPSFTVSTCILKNAYGTLNLNIISNFPTTYEELR
jgi:hypothetical protein